MNITLLNGFTDELEKISAASADEHRKKRNIRGVLGAAAIGTGAVGLGGLRVAKDLTSLDRLLGLKKGKMKAEYKGKMRDLKGYPTHKARIRGRNISAAMLGLGAAGVGSLVSARKHHQKYKGFGRKK